MKRLRVRPYLPKISILYFFTHLPIEDGLKSLRLLLLPLLPFLLLLLLLVPPPLPPRPRPPFRGSYVVTTTRKYPYNQYAGVT